MRKYLFCAAIIALVAVSCNKDKDLTNATVIDTGDIAAGGAAGGCGYLLRIDGENTMLRPSNLPSAYYHDGYKVKIKFDKNGDGEVCSIYPEFEFIEIIQLTEIKPNLD